MNRNLISKSANWKDDLPAVFAWIKGLKVKADETLKKGVNYVVAAQADAEMPDGFSIDARLDDAIKSKVKAALTTCGWSAKGSPCRVQVDQISFLAIPLASKDVHRTQRGRQIGIDAAAALDGYATPHLAFIESSGDLALDMVEGFLISQYSPGIFRTGAAPILPQSVSVFGGAVPEQKFEQVRLQSEAAMFMRFLQDCPPNWLNATMFAQIAKDLASEWGVVCKVLGPDEMQQHEMGAFLAVGKGSEIPPQLIVIEIPGQTSDHTVALVGKGLTFDAGGISIKPSASMEEMKYDMSGAAAVLGAAMVLAKQRPKHRVVCLIGAVENVLSSTATRPSDIVKTMSGKTVEIINTDAEGRLVLCDVMSYANKFYKPSLMVDIATLTGAVIFALGHFGSAVLSTNDRVADLVTKAGTDRGEPIWRLPMWPEVAKEVKSDFADLANIPKPNVKAGTIMGAAFLREFAGDTPWAHLDVAGTAWACMATGFPKNGGSSYGLRTLVEICHRFES